MDRIIAQYRAVCAADQAEKVAKAIAWEQTVEVVEAAVPWPELRERMVGRVEQLSHDGHAADITISYNPELAVGQIAPLFNLAYGNVALYRQIRLTDFRVPNAVAEAIGGPRYGVAGLRRAAGVYDRPLLCTALKPRGASNEHLADLAYRYALGGGDLIKDDQNLAEADLHAFQHRVLTTHQALQRAADERGRRCLYFPHITGSGPDWRAKLDFIRGLGIDGALFCPLTLGFGVCQQAARDYDLLTLYHPSLAGAFTQPADHGIDAAVMYGLFYRLAGADVSIFLGPGGRLSLSEDDNRRISQRLREPLGTVNPSMPCAAGGKTLAQLPQLMKLHGRDSVLLVGGALLTEDPDLSVGTRRYIDAIRQHYPGREDAQHHPRQQPASYVLTQSAPARWIDRQAIDYKQVDQAADQTADFAGVSRWPLIGDGADATPFAMRYFELAPGGYTSLERHVHAHAVVVVRGLCQLRLGDRQQTLKPLDVAYIDRLETHQLHNAGDEPCGFFCIVDRWRDRPQPVDGDEASLSACEFDPDHSDNK
ncbi:MAG: hypothetical protein Tsb002_08330 [Wenzhouxiangellaceae bacterium]